MSTLTLYHNPRCSKSRQALALLEARGVQLRVIHYLETPPDTRTLHTLLTKLGLPVRAVLRHHEPEFAALGLDDPQLDDDALLAALIAHPRLLERPIAETPTSAVIGRPPERVLELL